MKKLLFPDSKSIRRTSMKKLNCWEVKKCERFPGGSKEKDLGVCPAATEKRLNDIHGGINAGRACWVVANSLCDGKVQGSFATKFGNCKTCDFYTYVKKEEFPRFQLASVLLKKITG
jgi:hypothetical protein